MAEPKSKQSFGPMGHGPHHMNRFTKEKPKIKDWKATVKSILKYMDDPVKLILTFLLSTVTVLVGIVGTRMNGSIVDDYILVGDLSGLKLISMILIAIYMVGVITTYFQNRLMVRVAQETSSKIRMALYQNVQKLSIKYFDTHSSGDIMSRMTNDIDNINMTLAQNLGQFFSSVINIVGMAIAMVLLSPWLFLAGLITVPLMTLVTKIIVTITQPFFVKQQQDIGQINGYIEEQLSGQKAIVLFGQEERTLEEFALINDRLYHSNFRAQAFSGIMGPGNNLINNLTYFIIAVTGAYLMYSGHDMTVGIIFTFILYMRNFVRPINQLMTMFSTIQSALAGAERVFEVIDEPKEDLGEEANLQPGIHGDVAFDQVDFAYESNKPILKKISLKAVRGKTIAIVGPTGSGKTTIINLLPRFYDVDGGDLTIDGHPSHKMDRYHLRSHIATVLQDTFLFSDTIRENIRYGNLQATDEEVERAAHMANAHHFILQLREGYDTQLTDNGTNLSQGQRQLIAIARAILTNAAILILDEATSSIDTRTEVEVQKALLTLMEGKTTFIIAHRLSTIRNADEILVLDQGQIIESGDHDALLKQDGFYAMLYKQQLAGIEL